MRVLVLGVAVALWIGGLGDALACSCGGPTKMAARLDRAANVVQGRIVGFRADESTMLDGERVAVARMNIASVVKGDIPLGEATIVTGNNGDGDCGISITLLEAMRLDWEVTMEVQKVPGTPAEYSVGQCGYLVTPKN